MKTYKHWPVVETIPKGWNLDKTVGSPLAGYSFITNGKSVVNGQKRALFLVRNQQSQLFTQDMPRISPQESHEKPETKNAPTVIDAASAKTVNELARERFKQQLLGDILIDLMICEIEGWGKMEYINQMKKLIGNLAQNNCIDAHRVSLHGLAYEHADAMLLARGGDA